jgi:IS4 transposase
MYETSDYQTWKGLRILAVDGSKVMLPTNDETISEFGVLRYDNGAGAAGEHSYAVASVLYDVLNRIAIDAVLKPAHAYEVDLAAGHLEHTKPDDLVIYDRGYCSYRMMALASRAQGDFLIRCPSGRINVATDMLSGNGPDDAVVTLTAPAGFVKDPSHQGLPVTLTVRFIRVALDNGECEVLATSLLDQQLYTPADFKELYYLRWGIETFYGILKTRLVLENFSGYSPEAIRQDFFSTVFLCGVESIFISDAEEELGKQLAGHPKKVNKAVSFNAIKNQAFELFLSDKPHDEALAELDELFLTSPTLIRKDRKPPRVHHADGRVLAFWKRKKKIVF